jgi:hypothetical protein
MNVSNSRAFWHAIEALKFENKLHLSHKEIARLVEELNSAREYELADYIRSLDPSTIADLLRR